MEWTQFIIMFLGMVGLFAWNRTEARADNRHMDAKLEGQRMLLQEIWRESKESNEKWLQESKDFHGRLIAIEERNRNKS